MKSAPEHACEECNEMLQGLRWLKHEMMRVKRLPLAEIPGALNVLQVKAGEMETQMWGMKSWVTAALHTQGVREVSDVVPLVPRVPSVPQFPEHSERTPQR